MLSKTNPGRELPGFIKNQKFYLSLFINIGLFTEKMPEPELG